MLTEAAKERLKQEEIFRVEIRSAIESRSNPRHRLWKFINSPFGLWALSSIVLALITWSFSYWQASSAERVQHDALTDKMNIEIAARLRNGKALVHTARTKEQLYIGLFAINGGQIDAKLDFGVFPEFRTRSLQSLIYELQHAERNSSVKSLEPQLRVALEIQKIFTENINNLSEIHSPDELVDTAEKDHITDLLNELTIDRWR